MEWEAYDDSGARYRHIARIREYLGVRKFDETAKAIATGGRPTSRVLARRSGRHHHIVIEQPAPRRYEAPSVPVLQEEAKTVLYRPDQAVRRSLINQCEKGSYNDPKNYP